MQYTVTNATLATMDASASAEPYGLLANAAIVVKDGVIDWVGPAAELPDHARSFAAWNAGGRLVTPGLVDCHTHVVYGGNRAREFELRLEGASYETIARAGGGIVSTVSATRDASEDSLLNQSLDRVDALIAEGVCTVEIKSGYGLDNATEIRMLRVARRIAQVRPVRVVTTFLGAHAIPAEFDGQADAYIDEVCLPTLRQAHAEGLVDAVDGFCENIAFSPAQIRRVFDAAKSLGLPVKLHCEQLSNLHGAALVAQFKGLSADHLEYLDASGVEALAAADAVAVLLPGAFYTLRETRLPPVQLLRDAGVRIAIATDCNPGSSPLTSMLLTMNMACTLFRLTPLEAMSGCTVHGANALGLADCGRLTPGLRADMVAWQAEHPAELAYRIGLNPISQRFFSTETPCFARAG
jgi:imidazolonepropionase